MAAAVVSGYFSSWAEAHKMPWNMCGSQVLPGMLGHSSMSTWGRSSRPAPCSSSAAARTTCSRCPWPAAEGAKLRRVYAALDADDRLVHDVFAGGHQWHGVEAYPFFERWIGPGDPAGRE